MPFISFDKETSKKIDLLLHIVIAGIACTPILFGLPVLGDGVTTDSVFFLFLIRKIDYPAVIVLNSSYNQVGVLMSDIIPQSSLNYKGATLMSDEYQD